MDINKIDKIDTNLVLPNIQYNLMEIERDKWGNILNEQTFKTLNNNMKIMKEILLEIANENNLTNLDSIKLRLNNLETDRDSIESIVDNNTNGLINVGITDRKLNLKGTELEFNNNEINLDDIAFKSKNNTFKKAVNTEEHFSIEGEKIIDIENSNVNVGNPKNLINLISSEDKILLNGVEFKQIATQTEVDNGLEDTKIVTSKKLKARLDSMLASITSTYVKLTQLATESLAGIIKISTTAQASAGTDDTTAVSPKKLKARLDSMLASITSTYVKLTQLATETVPGITRYGITDGTALEGKRLAEIIGLEFGGNIQDTGAKVTGKFYYDKALKYYYECIENNNLTYNDGSKFRAISNKPILDRLENLLEVRQTISASNPDLGTVKFFRLGKRATFFVYFQNLSGFALTDGTKIADFQENFFPDDFFRETEHVIMNRNNAGTENARLVIRSDGIYVYGVNGKTHYELKGSLHYIAK